MNSIGHLVKSKALTSLISEVFEHLHPYLYWDYKDRLEFGLLSPQVIQQAFKDSRDS
jgi:hypothetical protein